MKLSFVIRSITVLSIAFVIFPVSYSTSQEIKQGMYQGASIEYMDGEIAVKVKSGVQVQQLATLARKRAARYFIGNITTCYLLVRRFLQKNKPLLGAPCARTTLSSMDLLFSGTLLSFLPREYRAGRDGAGSFARWLEADSTPFPTYADVIVIIISSAMFFLIPPIYDSSTTRRVERLVETMSGCEYICFDEPSVFEEGILSCAYVT